MRPVLFYLRGIPIHGNPRHAACGTAEGRFLEIHRAPRYLGSHHGAGTRNSFGEVAEIRME